MTVATAMARHDARLVLVQKEQEVADVRRRALEQLEEQITAKDECICDLSAKLGELKQDFEFNIQLLEERDAELDKYDVEHAAIKSLLQQKDQFVLGLQAAHAQLEAEMRHLKATSAEAESSLSARVEELQLQLQDLRFQSNELMLRQQEHYEAQKRALQRALAGAEEEIDWQRRDMAAAFTMQMQGAEVRYKQAAEEARMEGELSRQRAAAAEQEAREAREREVLQSKAAEEAEAAAASREREGRALRWELDSTRKLLEARLAEATTQMQTAQHQHQMVVVGMADRIADLEGGLAAAQKLVEELKEQGAHSEGKREQQQREEVAALQLRLEQVFGRGKELEARVGELQSALKVAERTHREQLEGVRSEAAAELQAARVALADAARQHEAQLRDVREQLWVKEEEGRALRGRAEGLRASLEQRRCDLEAYKVQLVAAGERERQLQRQLVAAEMKLEARTDAEDAAAAGQLDAAARRLTEQRDTANAALQDALSRLAAKEAELQSLKIRLQAATTTTPSAPAAANPPLHSPRHAAPPRAPTSGPPSPRAAGSHPAEALHRATRGHRADAPAAGGPHAASSAGQLRGRPPPLSLSQSIQDAQESLADLTSLPSPHLADLPPSPGSNASYWLGPAPTTSPDSPPGMSPRSPPGSPHRTSPLDRSLAAHRRSQLGSAAGTQQQQQQQEVDAMRAALQLARAQNERLLGATAMMRGELEALHARQQELERQAGEVPADVGVLQAEVAACDRDLQHAYDHLAAVQQRLAGGQGGGEEQEVAYLRLRVGGLMAENRTLRRWVAAAQLDALASTAQLPPGPALHAAAPGTFPPEQQQRDEPAAAMGSSPLQPRAEGSCRSGAQDALPGSSMGPSEGGAAAAGAGVGTGAGAGGGGSDDAAGEVTAAAAAAAEEAVGELEGQLEDVQEEVAALRQENAQLMEMSSLLRAERDHLLQQLSATSPTSTTLQLSGDQGPRPSTTPSRGPWSPPTFLLPPLNPYLLPAVHSPPRRPSTSPPAATSSQPPPPPPPLPQPAHPRQASAAAAAIRDVLHAAAAGRRGGHGANPPQEATGTGTSAASSSATAAGPQGVAARPASGEAGGVPRAEGTITPPEASCAHEEARLADARPPPDQPLRSTTPTRRLSASGSPQKPYLPTTVSLNPSGPLGLAASGPPARPSPPSKISQRETPSQRATLRALQQRREQAARPKVRNYNIRE